MEVADRRTGLVPRPAVRAMWLAFAVLIAAYAAHQALGVGGSGTDELFGLWLNDALLWAAAGACLAGALQSTRSRAAWGLVSLALASWATGDTVWGIRLGRASRTPLTSVS